MCRLGPPRRGRNRRLGARGFLGAVLAAVVPTMLAATPASAQDELAVSAGARVPMSTTLAHGSIERRSVTLHGLQVRGAMEVVHDDGTGHVRTTAQRLPLSSPQLHPHEATVPVQDVPALVADALDLPAVVELERPPELVYVLVLGEPVLAWEAQLPLLRASTPSRPTVWLSAATGRLVDIRENVFASRARVFAGNPSSTPDPITIELREIDVDGPGVPLVGTRVRSLNCTTVAPAEFEDWRDDGECWPQARTFSDLHGDYFVPLPDIVDPDSGRDGDDLYAELSMYVHAERFLEFMAGRGLESYRCDFSTMLANYRKLGPPGHEDEFEAVNNAYFTDQCDPELGPTMLFGQGSEVDFAFDGDVVYHELGHGVVALLAPEGLTQGRLRSDGAVVDALAVNEALADYVSVMLSNDPYLADYVGRFWTAQNTPYIRSALNGNTCPGDLIGQSHNDGEPVMAALWAARARIGVPLDDVVFGALTRLPNDATIEELASALVAVAQEHTLDGTLSAEDVDLLVRELVVRGLDDCPRVVVDPVAVAAGRTMYLRKTSASIHPFFPGPMQLRYEVRTGTDELVVRFDLDARGSGPAPTASVLLKRGGAPIEFAYSLVARDDAGDPTGAAAKIREVILVEGDWDLEVPATRIVLDEHEARIGGLRPGEVVHVALVDTAPTDATATSVRVLDPDGADAEDGESSSGTDDDGAAGADLEHVRPGAGEASCACTSGPLRGGSLALVVLALAWRRRR